MIVINIEKNMRTYQGHRVLKVYSWLPQESVTLVSGPSGSGKTTLLKIIAGLIIPEKGILSFNGKVWTDASTKCNWSPQKRRAGFVFQDYALFPNMTVQQHLEYVTTEKAWINRLLHFAKLETLVAHKPLYLSGGQQQRLAIIRALAIKPELLLMDEPFSALDPEIRLELITGLAALIRELGATCIIVSHNPGEVEHIITNRLYIS